MIIMGIDPGNTLVGFGVLFAEENTVSLVDYGCLKILPGNIPEKLYDLETQICAVLQKHKPEIVGIEEIFFFKNTKTVIPVAQARGVIIASCMRAGTRILEFTPLEIKQSVTGYGRAEKKQIQEMLARIFKLKMPLKQDDASDAVAAAWCASQSYKLLAALSAQRS